jgi:hypothetical protein
LRYPKEVREFLYTTNQFERLAKEIKRMKDMNERLNSRRLRGFKEIESGNYPALPEKIFTQ